jgi:hypothetical protein
VHAQRGQVRRPPERGKTGIDIAIDQPFLRRGFPLGKRRIFSRYFRI